MTHRIPGLRLLLVGALLASFCALVVVETADAHTLTVKKARSLATKYAKAKAEAYSEEGLPVTRYGTLACKRKNAHVVDCLTAVEFEDGTLTCAQEIRVAFRNRKSRRLRYKLLGDEVCFDSEGNPVEKRALKAALG